MYKQGLIKSVIADESEDYDVKIKSICYLTTLNPLHISISPELLPFISIFQIIIENRKFFKIYLPEIVTLHKIIANRLEMKEEVNDMVLQEALYMLCNQHPIQAAKSKYYEDLIIFIIWCYNALQSNQKKIVKLYLNDIFPIFVKYHDIVYKTLEFLSKIIDKATLESMLFKLVLKWKKEKNQITRDICINAITILHEMESYKFILHNKGIILKYIFDQIIEGKKPLRYKSIKIFIKLINILSPLVPRYELFKLTKVELEQLYKLESNRLNDRNNVDYFDLFECLFRETDPICWKEYARDFLLLWKTKEVPNSTYIGLDFLISKSQILYNSTSDFVSKLFYSHFQFEIKDSQDLENTNLETLLRSFGKIPLEWYPTKCHLYLTAKSKFDNGLLKNTPDNRSSIENLKVHLSVDLNSLKSLFESHYRGKEKYGLSSNDLKSLLFSLWDPEEFYIFLKYKNSLNFLEYFLRIFVLDQDLYGRKVIEQYLLDKIMWAYSQNIDVDEKYYSLLKSISRYFDFDDYIINLVSTWVKRSPDFNMEAIFKILPEILVNYSKVPLTLVSECLSYTGFDDTVKPRLIEVLVKQLKPDSEQLNEINQLLIQHSPAFPLLDPEIIVDKSTISMNSTVNGTIDNNVLNSTNQEENQFNKVPDYILKGIFDMAARTDFILSPSYWMNIKNLSTVNSNFFRVAASVCKTSSKTPPCLKSIPELTSKYSLFKNALTHLNVHTLLENIPYKMSEQVYKNLNTLSQLKTKIYFTKPLESLTKLKYSNLFGGEYWKLIIPLLPQLQSVTFGINNFSNFTYLQETTKAFSEIQSLNVIKFRCQNIDENLLSKALSSMELNNSIIYKVKNYHPLNNILNCVCNFTILNGKPRCIVKSEYYSVYHYYRHLASYGSLESFLNKSINFQSNLNIDTLHLKFFDKFDELCVSNLTCSSIPIKNLIIYTKVAPPIPLLNLASDKNQNIQSIIFKFEINQNTHLHVTYIPYIKKFQFQNIDNTEYILTRIK
ncbi:hypothetical protein DLAC_07496 [Tieghemostelium lacteum]|uniref:Uncharacterized protein n=1 Tax=Tieghemostelium lacteum TaxID=361077 RepID=A0A151ZCW2_TIELA|nr:hypothetical protein DLAC_07496 [Tieghemostelium lacteum]|eukprot:KYQ91714.1 hypothetical protein DLAC_07496 [Tieghemostelium lacteum]